jgi:hypothetical protein
MLFFVVYGVYELFIIVYVDTWGICLLGHVYDHTETLHISQHVYIYTKIFQVTYTLALKTVGYHLILLFCSYFCYLI